MIVFQTLDIILTYTYWFNHLMDVKMFYKIVVDGLVLVKLTFGIWNYKLNSEVFLFDQFWFICFSSALMASEPSGSFLPAM